MSSDYTARHRAPGRHSAPRTGGTAKALRRPLISTGLLMAAVATTAAGVAAGDSRQTAAAAMTVSPQAISQSNEASNLDLEDSARLADAQQSANTAQSAYVERERRAAVARAEAAAQARKEAAERAAREKARKELEAQKAQVLADAIDDPRAAGRVLLADFGWSEEQFSCLDSLWTKESGWNRFADNPTSDAYGIPQSLPGSKMASVGSDWATNPVTQITWGLGYIEDRYGTPCSAWAHSQATNWY